MKRRAAGFLLLTALMALGENRAWADPTAVDFSYQWIFKPSAVLTAGEGTSGSVTFAVAPAGSMTGSVNSGIPIDIPGATVTTNASNIIPDVFNTNFSVDLFLTEGAFTDTITFTGSIVGGLAAFDSTLEAVFHDPTTQSVLLGNNLYTVEIFPTTLDVPYPGSQKASLGARLSISSTDLAQPEVGGEPTHNDTPEPSTLLLGATALLGGLAARRWRRKRG